MSEADQVREATRSTLDLGADADLSYITDALITEYKRFKGSPKGMSVQRADGTAADPAAAATITAATATYYGNHPARIGTCLYWKTNGVGQPCGTGFVVKACNWKTAAQTWVTACSGGYAGYRFAFSY